MKPRFSALTPFTVLAAIVMVFAIHEVFYFAPLEQVMGFVQKIFYFHVPAAWTCFLAVAVMAVGSILFLSTRKHIWDVVGDAALELAIAFGLMVLISGPLWGRKAWGVYWVWDVRLTSTLVLVLTLFACKIVRKYSTGNTESVSAALALFAVLDTIFVYYSIDLWRGTHPPKIVKRETLDPQMYQTLWICTLAFLLSFIVLLWYRIRVGVLRSHVDHLRKQVAVG